MLKKSGDIWEHYSDSVVVITTNIGWRKDGLNPMGAGIAKQAASMCPELPVWYGARCKKYLADTAVCYHRPSRFILYPTKTLNVDQPHFSWKSDSSIELIKRSSTQLQKLGEILAERKIYDGLIWLPLVGCSNGRLTRDLVLPILEYYLDDRFVLIER